MAEEINFEVTGFGELRKQLREKEMEVEILKKALHIFSKSDGRSTHL